MDAAARQQVALQKAQLQATAGMSADIREALLQLTDAVAQQKLLPGPGTLALLIREQREVYGRTEAEAQKRADRRISYSDTFYVPPRAR